ncbi:uncharacterized protein F5147DRAFT_710970 [Suillus discolor]|uniref:1-phosphatidylinositol 4-kinase n=1 Tax=Suillus discolor TaxID=1912936 RepID=A0A9P7JQY3_9AGAM|nr:uncharacterized protein F5147DRAFT_710970 [Suillus discolor]KAG2100206.1 hypothetical protein F5147DRAFT_710970 [Suillus discolor]
MDCLELNIRQRILSDLATLETETEEDILTTRDLIQSKAQLADGKQSAPNGDSGEREADPRAFMSEARAHCNIAFGELVANFPEEHIARHIDTLIPVLMDLLHDVPRVDFDRCLSWDEWALPDQLVFSTVSALLRICGAHPEYADRTVTSIITFVTDIVENLQESSSIDVLTHLTPCVHGLYRAITSTLYPWTASQWRLLSESLQFLIATPVLERINRLLLDIHQEAQSNPEADATSVAFCHTFISRYIAFGRPLSGYFIVCCVMEMEWTVLAQALASTPLVHKGQVREAAAANKAWVNLMKCPAKDLGLENDEETRKALRDIIRDALQYFSDLLDQIEVMETEPPIDTYAWETMSESLKLASVCSVALRELDENLHTRLTQLLSDSAPILDNLVQESALKATTVLVQSFPEIAPSFAIHLRRFVTSPLSIFEFAFNTEKRAPPPLTAAAKCLALCIKLSPGDDSIMSNMYSLLNYIAATSKEITESSSSNQLLSNPFYASSITSPNDNVTFESDETGLHGRSDEEKQLIGITTISVVTRLALEFHAAGQEEVTKLTISMLLQRLRTLEPTLEAAIAYNLVDLALVAPEESFIDVARAFSLINRATNLEDPRFSNNMVLAAQTRLARELDQRPDLYDVYLVELLTLFGDKGVAIQNVATSDRHVKTEEMIEQLASLLLPIEALLTHPDYSPHLAASQELTCLFRNMWFLCVLFHFTSGEERGAMTWLIPVLAKIATKTPTLVLENAHDAASEIEYSTVIRHEYAQSVISKHRSFLTRHIPHRASEIRSLSPGQVIFLLVMQDVESMRSAAGLPSSLVSYFTNGSLNRQSYLIVCMESIADKVMRGCMGEMNSQAVEQALPAHLSEELRKLLVASTHRISRARDVAAKYLFSLITSFPSLMCDPPLVHAILECLTLLRHACENEFTDEYNPVCEFHSERTGITLQLTDDYKVRNDILGQLQRNANTWFELALSRAPIELQSTLQKYLAATQPLIGADAAELGASVAETFAKAFGPVHRQLSSLCSLSNWKSDRARALASQLASKCYFAGEVAGLRLAARKNQDSLDKVAPQMHCTGVQPFKDKMADTMNDIRNKRSSLTVQDLQRLLFRCAAILISLEQCDYTLVHFLVALPFEVFTPSAVAAGIETWTWVIAERPNMEVAIMCEVLTSWFGTVKDRKGVFSASSNCADPFYHPISYSPTDKDEIDRATTQARRLLMPHTLVLQMLFSRLQAARYCRSTVMFLIQRLVLRSAQAHKLFSTHPLARELRYTFLLFGLETLKSSHLDAVCECMLRESLYRTAYSWFAVRPQWSFGANRVQVDADIKVMSEFLVHLQGDSIRNTSSLSSLAPHHSASKTSLYATRLKNINQPLRLLIENEIFRLTVWANPSNEAKRGSDIHGLLERNMLESAWPGIVRTVWEVDPAITVHLTERFKSPAAHAEVQNLVRSNASQVVDTPEALRFLIGDSFRSGPRRELKYIIVWAPVTPVIAVTFFERRHGNDPLLLQYAHRVLKQHPVDLTFFFVPQVVQALRFDDLEYIAQFIFETAKVSQLFCHQIIWNMKANCFKDDAAEIEDPMKPALDRMTAMVVDSLSGNARAFYDREFGFFNEVTSISGKLKPFIKKSKPEKKAKIDEEMAKIVVDVGVYLPSNPDGSVIDIDKKSGRPLQSHAKAPFMATFKVRKERVIIDSNPESLLDGGLEKREEYDVWQQAIFKVGDDCRQDVLALQIIAMFKNIFTSIGLTLYLFPYRVTATAAGCGVIDVVPNATSRDEMGRATVNDLLDFFISKYGGEETVAFQRARLNFIQSMAAYSVACYILQIKDRHNGNIMIDGEGHIVHIDFGFLFDIDDSFKLTHEMVVLMGGRLSQGYELFQHLTVKAFLAIRPHADQLVSTVQLMLGTGLPSFKGEPTIKRLKDRFALGLNERQAAEWMVGVIRNAHENVRSTAYDEFQRAFAGIPYK